MQAYRNAQEIISFLSRRGAKIAALQAAVSDDYWASALSSDAEGEFDSGSEIDIKPAKVRAGKDDLVWVVPGQ